MATEDVFTSKNMYTGETRRKGITVTKTGGTLNISAATITIYESDGTSYTAEADCTIEGGDVYKYVTAGSSTADVYAIVKYTDGSHIGKARLNFSIVQG